MQAAEITRTGGPEVRTYVERPQRSPGPTEVLIESEAIGVDFIDTYFRTGLYTHVLPFIWKAARLTAPTVLTTSADRG